MGNKRVTAYHKWKNAVREMNKVLREDGDNDVCIKPTFREYRKCVHAHPFKLYKETNKHLRRFASNPHRAFTERSYIGTAGHPHWLMEYDYEYRAKRNSHKDCKTV